MMMFVLLCSGLLWLSVTADSYLSHDMVTLANNTFNQLRIDRHCRAIKREFTIPSINKTVNSFGEWWQNYWEPTWACPLEERVMFQPSGSLQSSGDGGKWVCDLAKLPPKCLIYSFGSNGEYSFEFGLLQRLGNKVDKGCEIHTFDPFTAQDASKAFSQHAYMQAIHIHPWGLAERTYTTPPLFKWENRSVEMKSLYDIVKLLKHEQRTIDVLKIDIDGTEFQTLQNDTFWKELDTHQVIIHQLLIEVHFQGISTKTFRFRDENNRKVALTSTAVVDQFMRYLTQKGFVIFHKEVNLIGVPPNDACEFSMLRLNLPCSSKELGSLKKRSSRQNATAVRSRSEQDNSSKQKSTSLKDIGGNDEEENISGGGKARSGRKKNKTSSPEDSNDKPRGGSRKRNKNKTNKADRTPVEGEEEGNKEKRRSKPKKAAALADS